jgi:signal peptidase
MDKRKLKNNLIDIGKDILIAFVVVALVMVALFAYCGIWPPMVVVESGSMQRYDDKSVIGVIDTGDMVFVKKVNGVNDVVTYVDGEATDYSKYGTYGDVIVYRPNGLSVRPDGSAVVPIIHRLVVWLEVNDSRVNPAFDGIDYANYSFDVPSLGKYDTTENIVLTDYGFWKEEVVIELGRNNGLLKYYEYLNKVPHGGYITMGDHNVPAYDQPLSGSYEPILPEWIVGKAIGELPWFGLIKLKVTGTNLEGVPGNSWTNLIITLFVLLFLPFAFDYIYPIIKKKIKAKKEAKSKITDPGRDETTGPPENPAPSEEPGEIANPGGSETLAPAETQKDNK